MKEGEVRFVTRAYDYSGKLLDDTSFIAAEEYDIIHSEEDITDFMIGVLAKHKEGEYVSD